MLSASSNALFGLRTAASTRAGITSLSTNGRVRSGFQPTSLRCLYRLEVAAHRSIATLRLPDIRFHSFDHVPHEVHAWNWRRKSEVEAHVLPSIPQTLATVLLVESGSRGRLSG